MGGGGGVYILMEFVKQTTSFPVERIDIQEEREGWDRHGALFPNSIRCIICGPSNSGKTNILLNLLTHPRGLRFANCYVYSKSLKQPKYQFLEKVLKNVKGMGCYFFDNNSNVIPPSEVKPDSIMIFDDVLTEKQDIIGDYFAMGRHNSVDTFYLCQSYAKIPKHLIRDNTNFLILFKQDETNTKHVFDDHVAPDMSYEQFRELCKNCWKTNKYGCVVIASDYPISNGRYRRGFDEYIKLWNNNED